MHETGPFMSEKRSDLKKKERERGKLFMDQLEKGNAKKIKKKPQKMFLQKKERKH